ncbi:hypothetical protein STENM327S_07285 [Streptomyces tendae]
MRDSAHSRYWWNSRRVGKNSLRLTNWASRSWSCRNDTKLNRDTGLRKVTRSFRKEICMVADGRSMFRCQPKDGWRSKNAAVTGAVRTLAGCSSREMASDRLAGPKPTPTTS